MKISSGDVKHAIARDGREITRSFLAGAAYMAVVMVVGGITAKAAANMAQTTLPGIVSEIAPAKFPKYSAHEMGRADRWNPGRWDTDTVVQPGVAQMASWDVNATPVE